MAAKNTVNIHGKEYEPVASRLKRFQEESKGAYSLITELLSIEGGFISVKCTIEYEDRKVTGLAMEEITSKGINSTSAMEVCETSAVGRAFAHMGYFGSEFPSADEMTQAVKGQFTKSTGAKKGSYDQTKKPSEKQIALIKSKCKELGLDYEQRMIGITTMKLAGELITELLNQHAEIEEDIIETDNKNKKESEFDDTLPF